MHAWSNSFTLPWPGGLAKWLRLDGRLFNKFNLTNRFLWGTPSLKYCLFVFFYKFSFSFHQWLPQEKVGRWRWNHILWKSTPVTHAGATLLGKLLLITLWQGDREPALWKLLILLFTPVIFLWWRVKMARKNNKGVGLIFPRVKSISINSSLWHILRASNQPKYVKTHVIVGNNFIN